MGNIRTIKTIIIDATNIQGSGADAISDRDHFMDAVNTIRAGGLVAFPTETVYGLGANALMPRAIENIYITKGRPMDNPLIIHVADRSQIIPLVKHIPEHASLLISRFMPGPLTLVFRKSDIVPYEVTAGLDTVAVRIPSHPAAELFLSLAGVPVAAPSANMSGRPSPTSASHVIEDLDGRIPYIIDGGDCEIGLESTVIDVTGDKPVVLRPGAISEQDILACCGCIADHPADNDKPRSPGMKYRHYAPYAQVIAAGPFDSSAEAVESINRRMRSLENTSERPLRYAVYSGRETIRSMKERGMEFHAIPYGADGDIKAASAGLFRALRESDKNGSDVVIVEAFHETGIGRAYMNRLNKASSSSSSLLSSSANTALPDDKARILFVCTGNTCRSPMAEYYFNDIAAKTDLRGFKASSAGIAAINGCKASQGAIDAMKELYDIDMSSHRSSRVDKTMIEDSVMVIAMTHEHEKLLRQAYPEDSDKIITLYRYAAGTTADVADPYGNDDQVYKAAAKEIADLTGGLLRKLAL